MKRNRFRILVVDDNPAIHEDFLKILGASGQARSPEDDILDAFLSGPTDDFAEAETPAGFEPKEFEIVSAHQGQEALALVEASIRERDPFAMAFVDVRMPPGWDGIQTLERIFAVEQEIQAVICTAYSDYSYEEMMSALGASERLLILKKPFDPIEVQQLANALVEKWQLAKSNRERLEEVRAYAASLETVNRALSSDKAMAVEYSRSRTDFIVEAGKALSVPLSEIGDSTELPEALRPRAAELQLLVGQMTRLAELEGGLCTPESGDAECPDAFAQAVRRAEALSAERGKRFTLSGTDELPAVARLDSGLTVELLAHLFEGAIDVCPGGSVETSVAFENDPGSSGSPLRVTVTIDGLELDPAAKASIFEPFGGEKHRLHLALARQLARLLKWELFAEQAGPARSRLVLRAKLDTGAPPGGLLAA